MFARYASAASSGVLMTFSLLYVMQALINTPTGAEVKADKPTFLTWVRVPHEVPVQQMDERLIRDELTELHPEPQRPKFESDLETIGVPVSNLKPPTGKLPPVFANVSDGPLVNLVRVGPVYPAVASAKGLEGHVIVQFDVGTNGLVSNVVVIESSNRIFNKPAIKAAERFKFKPRVVDGVALVTSGIRNLFRFEMDD